MNLPQLSHDKANHAVYGAVIFAVTYAAAALMRLPALQVACGMVVLLAVAKEVYDRANSTFHTPDPLDALATIGGGALCAIPVVIGG